MSFRKIEGRAWVIAVLNQQKEEAAFKRADDAEDTWYGTDLIGAVTNRDNVLTSVELIHAIRRAIEA